MAIPMSTFQTWTANARNNLSSTVSRLTVQDYIRLTVIVGAYCLLRPYLIQLGARFQAKDHEREIEPSEKDALAVEVGSDGQKARVEIPEDTDEEDGGDSADVSWGTKARRRQRAVVRRLLEAEEKRKAEEEEERDDKDIEEFLVD
ncbi:MAG: hypothetical protein M1833_000956 [Piccolia ochrophora]|nr:MAG: hypothetical protein M1833_000956 [Piccolia ochrophora]